MQVDPNNAPWTGDVLGAPIIHPGMDASSDPLARLIRVTMPYGKYKGTVVADLPGNYLNWFAREGFPSGELGKLLALMHEIDHNGLKHLLQPLRHRQES